MVGTLQWDYIIVGQGLAGSLLAWALHARRRRVLILDVHFHGAASKAAAGLINPLAGMRFSVPPRIDDWLTSAGNTYCALARYFGRNYYHSLPMVRLFRSPEQFRFWERCANNPAAAALLGTTFATNGSGQPVCAPFGGFHQLQTGFIDVPALLRSLQSYFDERGRLRQTPLDSPDIRLATSHVSCGPDRAHTVVFCEGHRVTGNPWFNWLPMQLARGEILTVQSQGEWPVKIVNGSHWIIPLGGRLFRVGSTFDTTNLSCGPTDSGRDTILAGLTGLLGRTPTLEMTAHLSGIRPGTPDRKPLLGRHPNEPRLAVFNGFGAKGSLTIPWYAQRFAEYLEGQEVLPGDADIARYAR